jgi:hypothetical protein
LYGVFLEAVASILHGTIRMSNGGGNKFDRAYNPYFNGNVQKSDGKNVHMPTVTFGGLDVYGAVAAVARRAMKGAFFHK